MRHCWFFTLIVQEIKYLFNNLFCIGKALCKNSLRKIAPFFGMHIYESWSLSWKLTEKPIFGIIWDWKLQTLLILLGKPSCYRIRNVYKWVWICDCKICIILPKRFPITSQYSSILEDSVILPKKICRSNRNERWGVYVSWTVSIHADLISERTKFSGFW